MAPAIQPLSSEFLVNTTVTGDQREAAVAWSPAGGYVAAWTSAGEDGSGDGVYARQYDRFGTPVASPFRVNSTTANAQNAPAVALDAAGNFIVVWQSNLQDGSGYGIYAQRYNLSATAVGATFRVNVVTSNSQRAPSVAMAAGGSFIIAWQSTSQDGSGEGIYARRYNASGTALATEFRVNNYTTGNQVAPSIALDAAGNFAIAYQSAGQDGGGEGVYVRRYNSSGTALAVEQLVSTTTAGNQTVPTLAYDATGGFIVAWQSAGQDGSGEGVFARRFNASGTALGGEIALANLTTGDQATPVVAADASGGFVALWRSAATDGSGGGVALRAFDSSGAPLAAESAVNTFTAGQQILPAIAIEADGDLYVAWQSAGQEPGGTGYGVYARRYSVTNDRPLLGQIANKIVNQGSTLSFTASASDPDLGVDTLTYSLGAGAPAGMTIDPGTGLVQWSPTVADAPGNRAITIQVSDDGAPSLADSITVHVTLFGIEAATPDLLASGTAPMDRRDVAVATRRIGNGAGWLVVWASLGQDGSGYGIFGQFFGAGGVPEGGEFQINASTVGDQSRPAIAMDDAGGFVVAWEGNDGAGRGIFARRFASSGDSLGGEIVVNLTTAGEQMAPAVAIEPTGEFVIVWQADPGPSLSHAIMGQRFAADGTRVLTGGTSEFTVTQSASPLGAPSVGMEPFGAFVVAWAGAGAGDADGVFARTYTTAGVGGATFLVNTTTTGLQTAPAVAMDSQGNTVIAWEGPDGAGTGVYFHRYDVLGREPGNEVKANQAVGGASRPAVAMDQQGGLIVLWEASVGDGAGTAIVGRRFDNHSMAQMPEFVVNGFTTGGQSAPVIAGMLGADFVAAWISDGQSGSPAVYTRPHTILASTPLDTFIATVDPAYRWFVYDRADFVDYARYRIRLDSGTFRTLGEVNRTVWQHWLFVYVPTVVTSDRALLFIDGGSNGANPNIPPTNAYESYFGQAAGSSGAIIIDLQMVPNQPLTFSGSGAVSEDDLIAYTWRKFLDTGDEYWPAQLPMARAAVRAMDAIQSFTHGLASPIEIDSFIVAGASKRGWTTWLASAVDPRVSVAVPIVIDVLNVDISFRHHFDVYGFWAPAVTPYVNQGIMNFIDTPQLDQLFDIVDPYVYRDRLTMPKYIFNASGDQFFVPDSWQFYYDDLIGPKSIRYVANASHGLTEDPLAIVDAVNLFGAVVSYQYVPGLTWTTESDGTIVVQTSDPVVQAKLWQATNPTARDFRVDTIGQAYSSTNLVDQGGGVYRGNVANPAQGWRAYFIEISFANPNGIPFKFSTGIYVKGVNSAPTLAAIANQVIDEGATVSFTALASDPNPGDLLTFSLAAGAPTGASIHPGTGLFTWTTTDSAAGPYSITVLVTDSGNPGLSDSKSFTVTVNNVAPTTEIAGPNFGVRGQPRDFVLSAADASSVDQAASFTFLVDWDGNGTTDQTIVALSGTTVSHVFATSGVYNVGVRAVDKDGGTSAPASLAVTIGNWALQTDPVDGSKTNLVWGGTNGFDAYGFVPGLVLIQAENNQFFGSPQLVFTPEFNGKLVIFAQGAGDLVFADVMFAALEIHGGDGDDVLVGGRGADTIDGGAGADILFGGTLESDAADLLLGGDGDDLLVGHLGADTLQGGAGMDFLIAGAIPFSDLPAATFAIQAEWLSSRPLVEKAANILGTGAGERNNNDFFLDPGATLADDERVDLVFGDADADWLILDPESDTLGPLDLDDLVTDLAP